MPTVLITGAGRGIGLELARQYAADGWEVIATVRDSASAPVLATAAARVEMLDMRDAAALTAFPERLNGAPLDLFIANAGVSGPKRIRDAAAAQAWQEVHAVNAVAPTLLAEALLPNVRAARGTMAAITSHMGSIADSTGGSVAYRASKAALNAAWRALSLDLAAEPVTLALFHPGWVRTDMGGPNAPLTLGESVRGLRAAIAGLGPGESGVVLDHRGAPLPW